MFNPGGHKHRPVVWINNECATVYTRFIGAHGA